EPARGVAREYFARPRQIRELGRDLRRGADHFGDAPPPRSGRFSRDHRTGVQPDVRREPALAACDALCDLQRGAGTPPRVVLLRHRVAEVEADAVAELHVRLTAVAAGGLGANAV